MKYDHPTEKPVNWLHISLLIAAIIIAYAKVLQAGFIAWDDGEYVLHNKDITGFSIAHVTAWFSRFYIGNYHPLTMAVYALGYLAGGGRPFVYHLTNILIHTCTAIVVYFFINKIQHYKKVGLFVALLFAVHPVQTEAVSWVAECKTLLCALFYMLALNKYIAYARNPASQKLIPVLLSGLAALLSKAVAVALPLTLLIIDIGLGRSLRNKRVWLEKLPFFVMVTAAGIIAINAQQSAKFFGLHPAANGYETALFAAYAYVYYIMRMLMPVRLSVIYPYPEHIGMEQYICAMLAITIIALGITAYLRRWRILFIAIAFYTVNIIWVLQFIQFGEVLMADRYLYMASIGIVLPCVYFPFVWLQQHIKPTVAVAGYAAVTVVLLVMTFLRNDIWLSDLNFFNSIVDAYPNSAIAQYSVAMQYMHQGQYAVAEEHLDKAVAIDPNNYKAWYDKGILCLHEQKVDACLTALNKCIAINEYPKAYLHRAMLYKRLGKQELALADIERTLGGEPENARAYVIKAECMEELGRGEEAISVYGMAIAYNGNDPIPFIRRGVLYCKTKHADAALNDLNKAVQLSPANGEALYFRGIVKYHCGLDACSDFVQAQRLGYIPAADAIARICQH